MSDSTATSTTPEMFRAAHDFHVAVKALSEAKQISQVLNQFKTRRQELQERVAVLASTVTSFELLPNEVRDELPPFELDDLQQQLKTLADRFADEPTVITRPKAFDAKTFDTAIEAIRNSLSSAWREWVTATNVAIGLHLIDNADWFSEFRQSVARIRRVKHRLQTSSERLPTQSKDVDQVREAKDILQEAVSELVSQGLDDDKLEFLHRSGDEGFSLEDLFANNELIEWLRQSGLLRYCSVLRRDTAFK